MYDNEKTEDYMEAAKWYRKAAEQEIASALNNLGVMYQNGKGMTEDYIQSYAWYNLAVSSGSDVARKNRDKISEKMTLTQIAEAQALAKEWATKYNK